MMHDCQPRNIKAQAWDYPPTWAFTVPLTRIIQRLLDVGRTHTVGSGEGSSRRGSGVHNG